ncbi:MAG: hypothetical protein Kapaf2KO_23510 [Candidatus Kapaibacteriales bacterium]
MFSKRVENTAPIRVESKESDTESICKNCGYETELEYCGNCGQKMDAGRISLSYVLDDLQEGAFSANSGLLYTIKELFTRPGATIKEFLEGKRVRHFRPVTLLLILAAFYSFLVIYVDQTEYIDLKISDSDKQDIGEISDYIKDYYSWIIIATVPIFSLFSRLFFRKSGLNYFEHLILNTFAASQRLIVNILLFPTRFVEDIDWAVLLHMVQFIIDFGLFFWVYKSFFRHYGKAGFFRIAFSYLFSYTLFVVVILVAVLLIIGQIEGSFGFINP